MKAGRRRQSKTAQRETLNKAAENNVKYSSFSSTGHHFLDRDNCTHPSPLQALNIIAYADCSSYENTAIHANCLSEEMLWHESWLELQGGVICEG